MIACKECRFWDGPILPGKYTLDFQLGKGICDLTIFEDYSEHRHPESLALCHCWNRWAHLLTVPEFGCVQGETKKGEDNGS